MQTEATYTRETGQNVGAHDLGETGVNWQLHMGQMKWVEAYDRILDNPLGAITGKVCVENLVDREKVAIASKMIGDETFYRVIRSHLAESKGLHLVQLGGGAAKISIEWLLEDKRHTAVSIDMSPSACAIARKAAEEAGVSDRLRVVELDIAELIHCATNIIGKADVIEAAFVLHDHFNNHGEASMIALLNALKHCLSPEGCLIITEAVRSEAGDGSFAKLFSIIHELQRIILPTDTTWRRLFLASGLEIQSAEDAIMPLSRLYALKKSASKPVNVFNVPFYREVHGHHDLVPFYFDSEYLPEFFHAISSIAAVELSRLLSSGPAQPHRHTHTEWYLLPAYPEPVHIRVTVDEETFDAVSPCLIKIPAGCLHSFRPVKAGEGTFILGLFGKEA